MSVAGQTFLSRKDIAHLVSGLQANRICSNTGRKSHISSVKDQSVLRAWRRLSGEQ